MSVLITSAVSYAGMYEGEDKGKVSPHYFLLLENIVLDNDGKLISNLGNDLTTHVQPTDNYAKLVKNEKWIEYTGAISTY